MPALVAQPGRGDVVELPLLDHGGAHGAGDQGREDDADAERDGDVDGPTAATTTTAVTTTGSASRASIEPAQALVHPSPQ